MHPVRALRPFSQVLVPLIAFAMLGCAPPAPVDEDARGDGARALGEGGAPPGSCSDDEGQSLCGGASTEGCWCDDLCISYGDCCADRMAVCAPSPALRVFFPSAIPASSRPVPVRIASTDDALARSTFVVTVDRASAGTAVTFPAVTYTTQVDGWSYPSNNAGSFGPCVASDPECLGPFTLRIALADHPDDVLATVASEAVPASHLPNTAPCLGGGNVADVEMMWGGPGGVSGAASLTSIAGHFHGSQYDLQFQVDPGQPDTSSHVLWISRGTTPVVSFKMPIVEALSVGADLTGHVAFPGSCNAPGDFLVSDLDLDPPNAVGTRTVRRATIAWRTACVGQKTIPLEGCVHYDENEPIVPSP